MTYNQFFVLYFAVIGVWFFGHVLHEYWKYRKARNRFREDLKRFKYQR